ncbi:MAG: DUF3105 domain-containing protein [Deltaproteobacteria bacterium]|jgi:hypothetical protein
MKRWGLVIALVLAGCSGDDTDDDTTMNADAGPTACGTITQTDSRGAAHVSEPTPIDYVDSPPSSGNHRPQWAKWGEYSELGPDRWLHNLEHGGAAFLYAPGDPDDVAAGMRTFATSRPADTGGAFRYILAPYDGLPQPIAVVTWEWTYLADEVCTDDIEAFLTAHYRRAPEDVASDGAFAENWITR